MLRKILFLPLFLTTLPLFSQHNIYYKIGGEFQAGSGDFAPYLFSANKHGISSVENNSGYLRAGVFKDFNEEKVFSYAAGIDLAASYNDYSNYRIQQLYFDLKYRCLNLSIGAKEYEGEFKNQELSSGGLVWSGNARPIPQIRAGIFNFVEIPGTNGWLQIKGDLSYGKFIHDSWLEDNFNYQYSFITTDVWYHQKKIFFRSKESKNFIVTIYAEMAAQFGGKQRIYKDGELIRTNVDKVNLKDFINVFIPGSGDETSNLGDQAYFYGNHLGSWNSIFEYKFRNSSRLKGYFEWIYEDGSGMGKLNGFDGLWGLEYNTNRKSIISDIVVEYLQTTNQSGPIHWAPNDFPGTPIVTEATGADDYYNNYFYNGWQNWGMANGNGLLNAPIYNKDGYLRFINTRVIGYNLAFKGYIKDNLSYQISTVYRYGYGTPFVPLPEKQKQFSALIRLNYDISFWLNSTLVGLELGYDKGNILNQCFGAKFSIVKSGKIL